MLDNGEPSFVILGYDSYKNLLLSSNQEKEIKINHQNGIAAESQFRHKIGEKEAELLEKINKEIQALKNEIEKEEKSAEIATVD